MEPFSKDTRGKRTVGDVLRTIGPEADERLIPHFEAVGLPYPPPKVRLLALKHEKTLEVWCPGGESWRRVATYPILGASGGPGPKLREGDRQVPEGFYRIEGLNPNSSYHLSMKLDYPNAFDRQMAASEGRTNLGGDIFIHGKTASIGCLAMGDPAIEELFTLVARTGRENVEVIILPNDLRAAPPLASPDTPPEWLEGLYQKLQAARMRDFAR